MLLIKDRHQNEVRHLFNNAVAGCYCQKISDKSIFQAFLTIRIPNPLYLWRIVLELIFSLFAIFLFLSGLIQFDFH